MKKVTLLLSLLCSLPLLAEHLAIHPLTGNAMQTALVSVGKVVYRGDSLCVFDHAGYVVYHEALAKIRRVDYSDDQQPTDLSPAENAKAQVVAYPNPTQGQLMVQHAEGDFVRIYALQGELLLTAPLYEGSATIDVSHLPAGTYLLLAQNGVFQCIKQ